MYVILYLKLGVPGVLTLSRETELKLTFTTILTIGTSVDIRTYSAHPMIYDPTVATLREATYALLLLKFGVPGGGAIPGGGFMLACGGNHCQITIHLHHRPHPPHLARPRNECPLSNYYPSRIPPPPTVPCQISPNITTPITAYRRRRHRRPTWPPQRDRGTSPRPSSPFGCGPHDLP